MSNPPSLGIRERFVSFAARISDYVIPSRFRARIVLGTDRENTIDSGYGDGGENDPESASIDIVAGFSGDSGNPNFESDRSRLYLSGKTNPDQYAAIEKGGKVEGEASILGISDNIYFKARKKVKIIGPTYSIIIDQNGDIEIESDSKIEAKVGSNKLLIDGANIQLDAGQGISGNIITDLDTCVGTDPVSGSPILSSFKRPESIVLNQKVKIK